MRIEATKRQGNIVAFSFFPSGEEAGENEPHVDSLSLDSPLIWIVLVVVITSVLLFGVVMAAIFLYRNYRVR